MVMWNRYGLIYNLLNGTSNTLPANVGNSVGERDIAELWWEKFS